MLLDSSGNLGLGVTPYSAGTGWKTLDVANYAAYAQRASGTQDATMSWNAYIVSGALSSGTGYQYKISGNTASAYEQNGAHRWYTAPSGTAGAPISFTQAMTLTGAGDLFLGATGAAFAERFRMNGAYAVFDDASYTGFIGRGTALGTGTASDFAIRSSNALAFLAGGATERARITSGGVFLVNSTTQVGAGLVGIKFNANNFQGLALQETDLGSGSTFISFINLFGTAIGSITQSGTSNVAYNTSSDYRLKDNAQPLTGSGAFIDALKPKTWDWKDGGKGVGFIAHEVQEVSPGTVVGAKDAVDTEGKPVYQAMEYGSAEFIANIIAELQSLRVRVAALETK
jgi:hypothetical protein